VSSDSIDVTMADDFLWTKAERPAATAEKGDYLRLEFAYGTFEGTIVLPTGDSGKLQARCDAGMLNFPKGRRRGRRLVQVLSFYIRQQLDGGALPG